MRLISWLTSLNGGSSSGMLPKMVAYFSLHLFLSWGISLSVRTMSCWDNITRLTLSPWSSVGGSFPDTNPLFLIRDWLPLVDDLRSSTHCYSLLTVLPTNSIGRLLFASTLGTPNMSSLLVGTSLFPINIRAGFLKSRQIPNRFRNGIVWELVSWWKTHVLCLIKKPMQ